MARTPPELQTHHLRVLELPRSTIRHRRHHIQGREDPCTYITTPRDDPEDPLQSSGQREDEAEGPRYTFLAWHGNANTQRSCRRPICTPTRPSNPKQPLMPHEIPSRPWQKLATDLFTWNERSFLVSVEYYSRFFEVDELTTTTSAAVIRKLPSHFARHGIPEVVVSDNGPQFASEDFATFATSWDFHHVTFSPGHPQSNGLAE